MKRYEKYKESGVEWIGEIPEQWYIKRLKYFVKICNGQDHKKVNDPFGEFMIYGSGGVFGKANSYLYNSASVLLGRKGTIDKPQYVDSPFWTVDTAYYTKILSGNSIRFFYYLSTTINFELYKYGSAIPSMTQGTLNEIEFCSPSLKEQTQIANYLDHKTTQLDTLIAKKERLIELLEEERTALINNAVTKGLDPSVAMKESGIDWLGEIPKHWKFASLKHYLVNITDGAHISPDRTKEEFPFVSTVDISEGQINFKDCIYTTTDCYQYLKRNRCQPTKGDILFSKDGTIGRTCIVDYEKNFVVASSLVIISPQPNQLNQHFLNFVLNSSICKEYTNMLLSGSALKRISITKIANMTIIVPPMSEQLEIVDFLDRKILRIKKLRNIVQSEITFLKEYKTALISEVVTGKVDVRVEQIR